jgi:hypothetical protein
MALFAVQTVSGEGGAAVNFNTCNAGGDQIPSNANARIIIDNQDAAAKTVTFTPANTTVQLDAYGTLTRSAIVVVVPATTRWAMKNPAGIFADGSNNLNITYSAVTSLKIASVVFQ